MPRNPLIARGFFGTKYAEDVGIGTNRIIRWCKEWGLPGKGIFFYRKILKSLLGFQRIIFGGCGCFIWNTVTI